MSVTGWLVAIALAGSLAVPATSAAADDACASQRTIPRGGGVVDGTTAGAGLYAGTCQPAVDAAPERVFRWTPNFTGRAQIFTCGDATTFDTVLHVRGGGCAVGGEVACADDGCAIRGDGPFDGRGSFLELDVTAGTTYRIFVDGYGAGHGDFRLTARPVPDACVAPPAIPRDGGTVTGTLRGFGRYGGGCGGIELVNNPEVAYAWRPRRSGLALLRTCRDEFARSMLYVREADCRNGRQPVCSTSCETFVSVTAGRTYFVFVDGFDEVPDVNRDYALDVILAGEGACCTAHAGGGCEAPACQECVCDQAPECCSGEWTASCATTAATSCQDICLCGVPRSDCCSSSLVPGCAAPACEQCVCELSPECCTRPWSPECAWIAVSGSCASTCACPDPTCGDGNMHAEEGCDDGNMVAGDGCDPRCQPEPCRRCAGSPSVCTVAADGDSCNLGPCTGSFGSCTEGVCTATPRDCDDGNFCTDDSCDARFGCVNVARTECTIFDNGEPSGTDEVGVWCNADDCSFVRLSFVAPRPATVTQIDVAGTASSFPAGIAFQITTATGTGASPDAVLREGITLGDYGSDRIVFRFTPIALAPGTYQLVLSAHRELGVSGSGSIRFGATAQAEGVGAFFALSGFGLDRNFPPASTWLPLDPLRYTPSIRLYGYDCAQDGDGTACSDGDACTVGDVCAAGTCRSGESVGSCDDRDPCTIDSCDPTYGCTHEPCNDGLLCTEDVCDAGVGCRFEPICDDGNPCTDDLCTEQHPLCVNLPRAGTCDDGSACTTGDTCINGTCTPFGALQCDDGVFCTLDSCDPDTGCRHRAFDALCADDDPCTTDVCDPAHGCQIAGDACATTTTTPASTTTSTSTTVPPREVCGDCADNDADGRVDFEDGDCCGGPPGSSRVRAVRIDDGRLRLDVALGARVADTEGALVLQLRSAGESVCAILPADALRRKRGVVKFRDPRGAVSSAAGITNVTLRTATGALQVSGRRMALADTAGPLGVVVATGVAPACREGVATLRPSASGGIRFP